ncbi:MAG: RsiV family protein [Bacillota bacterium]|nr:RsiV family protein [Bacillota bacterium]
MKNFLQRGEGSPGKLLLFSLLLSALLLCAGCGPDEESLSAGELFRGEKLLLQDASGREYSEIRVQLSQSFYEQLATALFGEQAGEKPEEQELCRKISLALQEISADFVAQSRSGDEAGSQAEPGYSASHQMELFLYYAGPEMISIRAELYDAVQGAAHPSLRQRAYNFDAAGNPLPLSALMGGAYPEAAFSAILEDLENRGELGNYYPELEQLLREGFAEDKWCANAEQICLLYDPYEIAAYAMGALEFPLPR